MNSLTAIRLFGPTEKRVLSMKLTLIRPVLPVTSLSPGLSCRPGVAGRRPAPRSIIATPVLVLTRAISALAAVMATDPTAAATMNCRSMPASPRPDWHVITVSMPSRESQTDRQRIDVAGPTALGDAMAATRRYAVDRDLGERD